MKLEALSAHSAAAFKANDDLIRLGDVVAIRMLLALASDDPYGTQLCHLILEGNRRRRNALTSRRSGEAPWSPAEAKVFRDQFINTFDEKEGPSSLHFVSVAGAY